MNSGVWNFTWLSSRALAFSKLLRLKRHEVDITYKRKQSIYLE